MEHVPVADSTTLATTGYDEAELTLELEFLSGELYLYRAVPSSLVLQLG
jgi:KTSC domain